jgi:hypothetical protein
MAVGFVVMWRSGSDQIGFVSPTGTKTEGASTLERISAIDHGAVLMWFLEKRNMLLVPVLLQTLSLIHYAVVSTHINDSCPTAAS